MKFSRQKHNCPFLHKNVLFQIVRWTITIFSELQSNRKNEIKIQWQFSIQSLYEGSHCLDWQSELIHVFPANFQLFSVFIKVILIKICNLEFHLNKKIDHFYNACRLEAEMIFQIRMTKFQELFQVEWKLCTIFNTVFTTIQWEN